MSVSTSPKMRAYLQDDRGSQLTYWIERSENGIVGWFATPRMYNQHIGVAPEAAVDVHFTYPMDGDLHFSLKNKTHPSGEEVFETAYFDRVRRKHIADGKRTVSEIPRDEESAWHWLMPRFRPHPLSDYAHSPLKFCFASTGIPVANGRVAASALDRLPREESSPPNVTPIPVSSLGTGTVNISACIYGRGATPVWPEEKLIWMARDESRFPHIQLFAIFIPTLPSSQGLGAETNK